MAGAGLAGLTSSQNATITGNWTFSGTVVSSSTVQTQRITLTSGDGTVVGTVFPTQAGYIRIPRTVTGGFPDQILVGMNAANTGEKIYIRGNGNITDDVGFGDGDFVTSMYGISVRILGRGTAGTYPELWLGSAPSVDHDKLPILTTLGTADLTVSIHGRRADALTWVPFFGSGFRAYNTSLYTGAQEYCQTLWSANVCYIGTTYSGGGTQRILALSGSEIKFLTADGNDRWIIDANGHLIASGAFDIGLTGGSKPRSLFLSSPAITAGSGTGLTVVSSSEVRRVVHKVTVTFAALAAAGLTADKTIATLPAKTRLVGIVADTTATYTGGGVTAASIIVGTTVGGAELVATHDVFTATITRGLADADLGTLMTRAAAIQGGTMPSWSATTNVSVRLTTVTANTDQLTTGSTTYYLVTEVYP